MALTATRIGSALLNNRLRFLVLIAALSLLWACYPVSQVSYSNATAARPRLVTEGRGTL